MNREKREKFRKHRKPAIVMFVVVSLLLALLAGYAVEMAVHKIQAETSSAATR